MLTINLNTEVSYQKGPGLAESTNRPGCDLQYSVNQTWKCMPQLQSEFRASLVAQPSLAQSEFRDSLVAQPSSAQSKFRDSLWLSHLQLRVSSEPA